MPITSSIGTAGIETGGTVDVDIVRAEPLERIGERCLDRIGTQIEAEELPVRAAQRAELDAQQIALARHVAQRRGDQHLVVAHAVEIAGIEQRDAGIERRPDGGHALVRVGRPVEVRHAHAAEADGGYRWAGFVQGESVS